MNTTHLRDELTDKLSDLLEEHVSRKILNKVVKVVEKSIKGYDKMLEIDSQFDDLFRVPKKVASSKIR